MFVDKKRAARLLRSTGLQLRPGSLPPSGYIGSITCRGKSVNLTGTKLSELLQESSKRTTEDDNITTIRNLTEDDLEAMYESPGIPVKSMLEDEDGEGKTIWSVGGITGRSLSPSFGSSSNHSGMRRTNSGRKASSNTIKSRKKIRNSE